MLNPKRKLSLECQMKQNVCKYSAVGDDRLSKTKSEWRLQHGHWNDKMCSTDTFYYSGFASTKEHPTIHSSMHLTSKPFVYPSIHPITLPSFYSPSISWTSTLLVTIAACGVMETNQKESLLWRNSQSRQVFHPIHTSPYDPRLLEGQGLILLVWFRDHLLLSLVQNIAKTYLMNEC